MSEAEFNPQQADHLHIHSYFLSRISNFVFLISYLLFRIFHNFPQRNAGRGFNTNKINPVFK